MSCNSSKNQKKGKKFGGNELKINDDKNKKSSREEYEIKTCFLGDVSTGILIATSICKNNFNEKYMNTIDGIYQQTIILLNHRKMKFTFWVIRNDERFRSMANLYYRDAQVAILTYDVTDEESLERLTFWINELNDRAMIDNILLYLVGNINDVESKQRKISTEKGKEFAEKNNMIFYEISTKTGDGVKELFQAISTKVNSLISENNQNNL